VGEPGRAEASPLPGQGVGLCAEATGLKQRSARNLTRDIMRSPKAADDGIALDFDFRLLHRHGDEDQNTLSAGLF
jgi:hypothetical protein